MPWDIQKKISLLAVAILFLFTFFNLILDAPRKSCQLQRLKILSTVPEFIDLCFRENKPKTLVFT